MKRKLWILIAFVVILTATLGVVTAGAEVYMGGCGDGVEWEFDTKTGTLDITGSGNMEDYDPAVHAPWYNYRYNITAVNIADGITGIGDLAFYDCVYIKEINIHSGITKIGDLAFSNCFALSGITVESGNTVYKSDGNCLIRTADNLLMLGCTNSVIPDYVTSIGTDAFVGCGFTSITIPASVTSISDATFAYCASLS